MICDMNDTIAAIATPVGESGIGIVRISGEEALKIADRIFVAKDARKPSGFKSYSTHYGWIIEKTKDKRQKLKGDHLVSSDRQTAHERAPSLPFGLGAGKPANRQTEIVDEVILTVMRAPRSYTKEDIVEINCHGGIVALRRALGVVLENGCRLALPGEFTKRAFLNGRIDLTQAEAVLDIIRAKTGSALKVGMEQLKGALSNEIKKIRGTLLVVLSVLEAGIDFPDEEIPADNLKDFVRKIENVHTRLKALLGRSEEGRILREGIHTVICGRPNVGKSSLLNALLRQERSIVTPVPGTTRDTIEEILDIKGIPVRIVDTAGIIEPRDLVERKAVLRSKKHMESADLILLVLDGSKKLSQEDALLMRKLKGKQAIAVINKMDLRQRIEKERIKKKFSRVVEISAKRLKKINALEDEIAGLVYEGKINSSDPVFISNLRHIEALKRGEKFIAHAAHSLDNKLSLEFIAQDIKEALGCLDAILGKIFSEDLLDKIFSEFCIGK